MEKKDEEIQLAHISVGFCVHGLNQPQIENIQEKNSKKFQKAEPEFALHWQQVFT